MSNVTDKEIIIDELSKLPIMELAVALSYAKNLSLYGVDVTEVWNTAVQQSYALNKAYEKGRSDERRCMRSNFI